MMAPAGFAGSVMTHTVMITALAAALFGSGSPPGARSAASLLLRWASAAAMARWLDLPRGGSVAAAAARCFVVCRVSG